MSSLLIVLHTYIVSQRMIEWTNDLFWRKEDMHPTKKMHNHQ
jgi:hypothetical protein